VSGGALGRPNARQAVAWLAGTNFSQRTKSRPNLPASPAPDFAGTRCSRTSRQGRGTGQQAPSGTMTEGKAGVGRAGRPRGQVNWAPWPAFQWRKPRARGIRPRSSRNMLGTCSLTPFAVSRTGTTTLDEGGRRGEDYQAVLARSVSAPTVGPVGVDPRFRLDWLRRQHPITGELRRARASAVKDVETDGCWSRCAAAAGTRATYRFRSAKRRLRRWPRPFRAVGIFFWARAA